MNNCFTEKEKGNRPYFHSKMYDTNLASSLICLKVLGPNNFVWWAGFNTTHSGLLYHKPLGKVTPPAHVIA